MFYWGRNNFSNMPLLYFLEFSSLSNGKLQSEFSFVKFINGNNIDSTFETLQKIINPTIHYLYYSIKDAEIFITYDGR